jgi:hypothetical protein
MRIFDLHQLRKFFYSVFILSSRVWRMVMKASVREHSTQHINEMMARVAIEPGTGTFVREFVTEATH